MALACNIDQRGRAARYRIGFSLVALAALAYVIGSRFSRGPAPLLVAVLLGAAGVFALFEANRGWCALRALGFKTKL